MKNRKIVIATIVMIFMFAQFSVFTKKVNAYTTTGSDGDISWSFDSVTETLTFSGSGPLTSNWRGSLNPNPKRVKKVIIQNGITSISERAFLNCTNLSSIEIPNSVTSIGRLAFNDCASIVSIEIPDSVTSIEDSAFAYCTSLASIEIDSNNENYSSIDGVLFNKNKDTLIKCPEGKQGNYQIPDFVTTLGNEAFQHCKNQTNIEIPSSITSIENGAFAGASSIVSIEVDSNNEHYSSIDGILFNKSKDTLIQCPEGKQGSYQIPDSVIRIDQFAFMSCASIVNVEIPDSVTSIELDAFEYCTSLTSIEIPDSVTSIGSNAFLGCTSLASIVIPDGVTLINSEIFSGCTDLTIYCSSNSTAHQYAQENNISFVLDDTAPTINKLSQDGLKIKIEATDNDDGCGLSSKPYSIDGENWQSSDEMTVAEYGTYTIYVRDKLGNKASSTINVTISDGDTEENKVQSDKNTEVNENSSEDETTDDNTKSNKIIPQTGATFSVSILAILAIIVFINYKKSKKYNY